MIIESNGIEEGIVIECDICIIGGGPAGISIGLELESLKKRIVILTGGERKETAFNRDLHRGVVAEGSSHEPTEQARRRQLGGASVLWGGRCLPLDPIDFEKRDWVSNSGWPITYDEMLPYYERAAEYLQTGGFKYDAQGNEREIIPGLDSDEINSTSLERWSPPVNFGTDYRKELESSQYIKVLMNAHALKIVHGAEADTVTHVDVNMGGKRIRVSGSEFILATGGLENPRLLLSSTSENHPTGLGNKADNGGRYYMAHYLGTNAELYLNNPKEIVTWYERDSTGVYYRRRWRLTAQAQEKLKLTNMILYLTNPSEDTEHLDPLFSGVIAARAVRSVLHQKTAEKVKEMMKIELPKFKKHSVNFLLRGWKQIPDITTKALKRIPKRRLPSILPAKTSKYWGLFYQAEQTPRRDSRIYLAEERDAHGMQRIKVDVKFNSVDIESIVTAHNMFIAQFNKSGAGRALYSEEGLREYLDHKLKNFDSEAHHIGTTRMSSSESDGVVDVNAKVYGMKNLYVTGASVFPTGGHANPTLTIIAQAIRLADHIRRLP